MHNQQLNQLLAMHTYKRPHGSEYEQKFIDRFLAPLADHHNVIEYNQDDSGNIWVTTSYNGKTLFTAHVDTVHSTTGIQKVTYDANLNLLYIDQEAAKTTNCLGADDTAGMWLLLQLIDAGVPGTFVFFRGEEKGGIGSSWAAKHMADYLKDFDRAIAFDRRGQTSVISHQGYGRCCSDDFATALSFAINATDKGVTLRPDSTGVFTDTANLTDLIGECTNVSCGYEAEHTPHENLDVEYLFKLLDALLLADFESLPSSRKPGEQDPADWGYGSHWDNYGNYSNNFVMADTEKVANMSYSQLVKWVRKSTVEDIAEVICDLVETMRIVQEQSLDFSGDYSNGQADAYDDPYYSKYLKTGTM